MYKDKTKQQEYQREKQRKYRERRSGNEVVTEPVTTSTSEVVTEVVTRTGDIVTTCTPDTVTTVTTRVRINPRDGQPYGPGMLGLLATVKGQAALTEYERKYGQLEPVYGAGSPHARLAEYALSEKLERIHQSLGQYAKDVRVGCYGPTVEELYSATH